MDSTIKKQGRIQKLYRCSLSWYCSDFTFLQNPGRPGWNRAYLTYLCILFQKINRQKHLTLYVFKFIFIRTQFNNCQKYIYSRSIFVYHFHKYLMTINIFLTITLLLYSYNTSSRIIPIKKNVHEYPAVCGHRKMLAKRKVTKKFTM